MKLVDLVRRLGLPRAIRVSASTWTAAAVLGLLRTDVNDSFRSGDRDRGHRKNILNDLQGSLGELLGQLLLDRAGLPAAAGGLLDLEGSVDLPDLVVGTDPPIFLDVKCHLDEPAKRLFLVNERARLRSVRRGVAGYLPIVAAVGRDRALVGRIIPNEVVASWKVGVLGAHHDAARQLPLPELAVKYLDVQDMRWGQPGRWGAEVVPPDFLRALPARVNTQLLSRLRVDGFTLAGLSGTEARDRLLTLISAETVVDPTL